MTTSGTIEVINTIFRFQFGFEWAWAVGISTLYTHFRSVLPTKWNLLLEQMNQISKTLNITHVNTHKCGYTMAYRILKFGLRIHRNVLYNGTYRCPMRWDPDNRNLNINKHCYGWWEQIKFFVFIKNQTCRSNTLFHPTFPHSLVLDSVSEPLDTLDSCHPLFHRDRGVWM